MRPIDADALVDEIKRVQRTCEEIYDSDGAAIADLIRHKVECVMPTIDAVPVVHGYWRPHPLGYTSNLVKYEEWDVCSNCGIGTKRRNMTDDFFEEYSYSYCPWCGAKMDAKEGTEE